MRQTASSRWRRRGGIARQCALQSKDAWVGWLYVVGMFGKASVCWQGWKKKATARLLVRQPERR